MRLGFCHGLFVIFDSWGLFCDVAHNRETCSNCNVWSAQGSKLDVFVSASLTVVRWLCLSAPWNTQGRRTVYHSLDLCRCKVTTCGREMLLRGSQRTFSGFSNSTAAGADIVGALICCSGCQLFLEGRGRHPRRGSFGCVSTALDKTTAFFAAQGFFGTPFRVYRALFLRAVRPAADTDFTCWRAVSWIIFSTDRRFCKCDVGGRCGRSGALFVCELFLVFRPELTPHRRTHVTSCSMCLHVPRCRDDESINNFCLSHRVSAAVRGLCDHVLKHILLHGANTFLSRLCVFVASANRVACRSSSAILHQFLRKYMARGVVGDFALVFAMFSILYGYFRRRLQPASGTGLPRLRVCLA